MDDPAPSRYAPRRDVSSVPVQGGYAAKRCPLRVQFDAYPPPGVIPAQEDLVERHRMDAGNHFEAEVFGVLRELHPDAVTIEGVSGHDAERATLAAMRSGARLILSGRLPTDRIGRRVGKPDVLVLAGTSAGVHTYHPVDVKHHRTLGVADPERPADRRARVASLANPAFVDSEVDETQLDWRSTRDLLQLAHYHRMLEAVGHAAVEPMGAIIGKEQQVVWHHLATANIQQLWDRSRSANESPLQRYDFEFSFRLDVLAAAAEGQPIVEPVSISECPTCPWNAHCQPRIVAADSTSLVPGHGYKQWHALRRRNIATRAQLASLDHRTARVVDAYQRWDLVDSVARAAALPRTAPVEEVVGRRSTDRLEALARHGIESAGDLLDLDPRVIALADFPWRSLATSIHQAAVAGDGHRPELAFGVPRLEVPRADVEIDIDMENALDGTVYLWGALAHGEYVAAASWDVSSPSVDAEVFVSFWAWLTDQREAARRHGRSVAIYCWFANAESTALRRGAAAAAELLGYESAPAEVEELLVDDTFVDLFAVFARQVVIGHGNGLKAVAPHAGFSWRDDDPGGSESMLWHNDAVTAPGAADRESARRRLLAYNEDDVRATATIRSWLSSGAVGPNRYEQATP